MTPLQQYLPIPLAFKPSKCELELVLNIDIINQDSNTTDLILVDFFFVNLSSTFSTLQDNLQLRKEKKQRKISDIHSSTYKWKRPSSLVTFGTVINNLSTTKLKQFARFSFSQQFKKSSISANRFCSTRKRIQGELDIKMRRKILAGVTGGFAGNFVHENFKILGIRTPE